MAIIVEPLRRSILFDLSGIEQVIQNVRIICTTRKGTVPLDREFGLDFSYLDDPLPAAQAAVQTDIYRQVKKYEPRAYISRITFDNDPLSGRLMPTVVIGEVDL